MQPRIVVSDNNVGVETQAATVGPQPEPVPRPTAAAPAASFGDVVALTVVVILGASLTLVPLTYLLLPGVEIALPEPFAYKQHQTAETLTFLLTVTLVLPLAVWRVPRLADRIAMESRTAGTGAAALSCVTLAAGLLCVRVSAALPWGDGLVTLLALMALWWAVLASITASALRTGGSGLLEGAGARAGVIWRATAGLVVTVIVGFAFRDSVSWAVLAISSTVVALVLLAAWRIDLPAPKRLGWVTDLVASGLLFLSVPNLVVVRPGVDPVIVTLTIGMHQNFFVAPASDLLTGGVLLVDTFSQYGVGSIAVVAGWFAAVGVGNGTLGLLEGLMSGFVFTTGYFVVRASGVGRLLAATGFASAIIVLVFGLVYPVGGILQQGAIRLGMPMLVLAATAIGLRFERLAVPARMLMFLTVGLSSIWALEALAYTVFTFAAVVTVSALLLPVGERLRCAFKLILPAAVACVAAQLIFAAVTLAIAGSLPDWAFYLSTLREFLTGRIGDLTYDFSSWSPGLGLGALNVASAAGVLLLVSRRRDLALRERTATILLAGSTAYGIALFTYLVNRSADHIVPYVSLPAFMFVMIWLGLLGRTAGRRPQRVGIALALATVALLFSVAWSSVDLRFSQSALAHVLPGGASTGDALARLRDMPELNPGAGEAELLLDRYWVDGQRSLVVTVPNLGIEALAQTGRRNLLPLTNPQESDFVASQNIDRLNDALAGIDPGELLLADEGTLRIFRDLQRNPDEMLRPGSDLDPLSPENLRFVSPGGLIPLRSLLQKYALGKLSERFDAEVIARGGHGLSVVELVPR